MRFFKRLVSGERPKGSVLVFALWVVVCLSLFAVALAGQIRQKVRTFQHFETKEELRWIAEAGTVEMILKLRVRELGTFTLRDAASFRVSGTLGGGSFGVEAPFSTSGGQHEELLCAIMDENRKINLNTAEPASLKILFAEIGELGEERAGRLAYAVKDFRDADDHVTQHYDSGSEKYSYQAAGFFDGPKNAPFECLSEILRVKGMTAEVFEKIRGYVTVYGKGGININTAEIPTLVVLGIQQPLAERIVELRLGTDGMAGTEDDYVFETIENFFDEIRSYYPKMTDGEANGLNYLVQQGVLQVDSDNFSFISKARMAGGGAQMRVVCVYGQGEGIRYWAEI